MSTIKIQPLSLSEGSGVRFGATVDGADIESLTGKKL